MFFHKVQRAMCHVWRLDDEDKRVGSGEAQANKVRHYLPQHVEIMLYKPFLSVAKAVTLHAVAPNPNG